MQVHVCHDSTALGQQAADEGAARIRDAIRDRGEATILVATGASQFATLAALVQAPDLDWTRVTGFHLDEYLGLPDSHAASFRRYLKERFVDLIPIGDFHYVNGETDAQAECDRLGNLIRDRRVDVAFIGIGENAHLAFNDPPADFETQQPYLVVNLDEACRRQQHGEGWFNELADVPLQAISMSISQIMKSRHIVCSVPDARKAEAVKKTLTGPITPAAPASNLQSHDSATLYLDPPAASLIDTSTLSDPAPQRTLMKTEVPDKVARPGYVDLQVNGYGGVDFNSDVLNAESLHDACQRLIDDGVASILATIITADIGVMSRRLTKIVELRRQDPLVAALISGIHIEGPFINEQTGYVGAHPRGAVCPADAELMRRLLDAADGLTRIVTLAPERDPDFRVTRMLTQSGVCVSAGHCDPSTEQLDAAMEAGLSMFTHLGNGCPLSMHRHDNIIQRVLSRSSRLMIGLIADGVHVPWPALGNYLRCAGLDRCFVVTDAISAAGLGPGRFQLGEREVVVDSNGATWAADGSHLVGSSGTMPQVVENLKRHLGLDADEVTQLTVTNPMRALR